MACSSRKYFPISFRVLYLNIHKYKKVFYFIFIIWYFCVDRIGNLIRDFLYFSIYFIIPRVCDNHKVYGCVYVTMYVWEAEDELCVIV